MIPKRAFQALGAQCSGERCPYACWVLGALAVLVSVIGCGKPEAPPPPSRKPLAVTRPSTLPAKPTPPVDIRVQNPPVIREVPLAGNSATAETRVVSPAAAEQRPEDSKLPFYELRMDAKEIMALERSAFTDQMHPATFIADGEVYENVKVRYRGAFARNWPKKPLKIFFNDKKLFHGQSHLNLNSGWRDPAFIRETLAYMVYAMCGAPASKSRMIRLHLNGQFRGLYVELEQPDKAFANRLKLKGVSIYKASSRSNIADERDLRTEQMFRAHYEKETQKDEGYADLQKFCQDLAGAPNTLEFFTQRVDLDKYINYLVATTLTQNWDGYNKNHFIVCDGHHSKKWFLVPWDLDRTFGDYWDWSFDKADLPILLGTHQMPGITGWNRIQDRFFSDPVLRARFQKRLGEVLEKEFTTDKLLPLIDHLESEIAPEAALDRRRWPSRTSDLHSGIAQLKNFVQERRAYLLRELASSRWSAASR